MKPRATTVPQATLPLVRALFLGTLLAAADTAAHIAFYDSQNPSDPVSSVRAFSSSVLVYSSLIATAFGLALLAVFATKRRHSFRFAMGATAFVVTFCLWTLLGDCLAGSGKGGAFSEILLQSQVSPIVPLIVGVFWGAYLARAPLSTRAVGNSPFVLALCLLLLVEFAGCSFALSNNRYPIPSALVVMGLALAIAATFWLFLASQASRLWGLRLAAALCLIAILPAFPGAGTSRAIRRAVTLSAPADHAVKRVLLITVDTMRADLLTATHPDAGVTQRIDELAADGVVFANARTPAPWTRPAVCSLMTGLSPAVHLTTRKDSRLSESLATWAEHLVEAGYYTAAFGVNANLIPAFGIDQGFMEYNWCPSPTRLFASFDCGLASRLLGLSHKRTSLTSEELADRAIAWLGANGDRDFFLWVHFLDPHMPYLPPDKYLSSGTGLWEDRCPSLPDLKRAVKGSCPNDADYRWVRGLYESEMRYVDTQIGRILDCLRTEGIYEEMVIALTSDHGEEFWEHAAFEHGHALFEEQLRIPLILKLPYGKSAASTDVPVTLEDIMPTVLDLCAIDYDALSLTGRSLVPLIRGESEPFLHRPFYATGCVKKEDGECMLTGNMKYIHYFESGRELLYDLAADRGEKLSLANPRRSALREAQATLQTLHTEIRALRLSHGIAAEDKAHLDEEALEALHALGYF